MKNFIKSWAVSRSIRAAIVLAGLVAIPAVPTIVGQTAPVVPAISVSAITTNLTACTCINDVILRANALLIKPSQHKALLNTLTHAGHRIARCQVVLAGRLMVQFVKQTQRLVKLGALDQATVNSLATCAGTINLCGLDCLGSSSNQAPVALAKPLVLSADANCQADPPASQFDNGSYDPNGVIVGRSVTPPGPYPLGETVVTYAVVDNRGSLSSVSTTVLVKDTTGPSISNFAPNFLVFVTPGQSSGTALFPAPAISDNCSGVASVTFAPPSGSLFPLGVTPAALILVNSSGDTNRIAFNVVVIPVASSGDGTNLPPVAIAQAVTNSVDANCQGWVTAVQVDNHSFSPNPNGVIVSKFVAPTGPFPVGTTTPVTLTVVDNQGLANSTVTTVTVINRTPPSFVVPPLDVVVMPAAGQTSALVNYPALSVTGICSSVVGVSCTPPSGTVFGMGTNAVTCAAFDAAGNTNSTTFQVIVTDFYAGACDSDNIPQLIQHVNALPLTGQFTSQRKNQMVQKLEAAQHDVTLSKWVAAKIVMGGFITVCSTYQTVGVLDSSTASPLIICATNIQNALANLH